MRFVDIMLCFPQVFLLLVVAAFVTPTLISISLIIGLTSWMEVSRIIRSEILHLKEQDFVQAARALGASGMRIMVRELMPNIMAPLLVAATLKLPRRYYWKVISPISATGCSPRSPAGQHADERAGYFDTEPWLAILPVL